MVKKSMLERISKRLTELCEEYGVSSNLAVVNFMDNECDVEIAKDLANERREQLDKVCEGLRKVQGIQSIFDEGHGKVLRGNEVRRFEILVSDGEWIETEQDEIVGDRVTKAYFDEDEKKRLEQEKIKEKRKYWKEYILPMPKPDGNANTELYLTMGYEPYDWIDKGYMDDDGKHKFKRTEFREYTENYAKRLLGHPIKTVKFQRGYGGRGQPKPRQMVFEVKSITLWDSQAKLECDPRHLVEGIVPNFFAINLGRRLK